jgi:hypothetical protein
MTDVPDLIKRLREYDPDYSSGLVVAEAADCIEKLMQENEQLKIHRRNCEAQHGDLWRCVTDLHASASDNFKQIAKLEQELAELKAGIDWWNVMLNKSNITSL